jgi:hypothetical protein
MRSCRPCYFWYRKHRQLVRQEGGFVACFPLNVSIVRSSTLIITTNSKYPTCGGFSLGETVHFGSLKFIVDYFGSLSLSPMGSDSSTVFIGTTCNGSPSLRTIDEDSTDEFYTTSSEEGSSGLPISWRRNMGTPLAPIATTPRQEDAQTPQTMMMVPPWTIVPRPDTGLPLEQWHAFWEGQQARACSQQSDAEC